MDFAEFVRQVPGLSHKSHSERIKLFGWYLHAHRGMSRFTLGDMRGCYQEANLAPPANLYRSMEALREKSPAELLKDAGGYRLEQHAREALDRLLGRSASFVAVEAMLGELPGRIADEAERLFLAEVLTCYRNGAFRSAIVMAWNLAYDHLLRWTLTDPTRLAAFNSGIAKRNPKKAHIVIHKRDDFEELKEDEVIDIAGALPEITGGLKKLLKEKLGRRNTFAHPSRLHVGRAQVDDMITDLVNNVVLQLRIG